MQARRSACQVFGPRKVQAGIFKAGSGGFGMVWCRPGARRVPEVRGGLVQARCKVCTKPPRNLHNLP